MPDLMTRSFDATTSVLGTDGFAVASFSRFGSGQSTSLECSGQNSLMLSHRYHCRTVGKPGDGHGSGNVIVTCTCKCQQVQRLAVFNVNYSYGGIINYNKDNVQIQQRKSMQLHTNNNFVFFKLVYSLATKES